MGNKMLEKTKNKLDQMEIDKKNSAKKIEIKETETENKRLEKTKKGSQKVYYEIWKQILKNINKSSCFNVRIYITFDGDKTLYVTKIKVDENLKKITNIPINKDYLEHLLNNDGLSLDKFINGNIYKTIYVVPVSRTLLKADVNKNEKSKELKKGFI